MKKTTIILHENLIRLARGMIKAWETWLNESREDKRHGQQ